MFRLLAPGASILRARMGPLKVYIITNSSTFQAVFRKSKALSFEYFLRMVMEIPFGYAKAEIDLFFAKRNGKSWVWDMFHDIHHEQLTSSKPVDELTDKFVEVMALLLHDDRALTNGEGEVLLWSYLRHRMTEASVTALCGTKILELNPTFIEDFWDFDSSFVKLSQGFPRFAFRKGYEARDKILVAGQRWLAEAWKCYDWDGPDADAAWDENFGARVIRTRERTFVETVGSTLESRASSQVGVIFA